MPAGLQIWDANGSKILEITDRITKILGRATTVAGPVGGSFTDDRLLKGTGFAVYLLAPSQVGVYGYFSNITFSGSRVIWTRGDHSIPFIYGIF